jgi:hypothetical protein
MSAHTMEHFCVKCKKAQQIDHVEDVTFKNGRPAKKGKCTVCGTTVCKIVAAQK